MEYNTTKLILSLFGQFGFWQRGVWLTGFTVVQPLSSLSRFRLLYYLFSSAILTSFFKSRFMNQSTIRHLISVLFRSNSFINLVCMYGDSVTVNILNLWVNVSNFQLSLTMLGVMLPLRKLHLLLCRKAGDHTLHTIPLSKFLCLEKLIISGTGRCLAFAFRIKASWQLIPNLQHPWHGYEICGQAQDFMDIRVNTIRWLVRTGIFLVGGKNLALCFKSWQESYLICSVEVFL